MPSTVLRTDCVNHGAVTIVPLIGLAVSFCKKAATGMEVENPVVLQLIKAGDAFGPQQTPPLGFATLRTKDAIPYD